MLLSFAVLFGMRYDVGQDHLAYLDGYINPFLHKEYEPLFALIRDTLSNAGVYPPLIKISAQALIASSLFAYFAFNTILSLQNTSGTSCPNTL